jgi:hypothetical protein
MSKPIAYAEDSHLLLSELTEALRQIIGKQGDEPLSDSDLSLNESFTLGQGDKVKLRTQALPGKD